MSAQCAACGQAPALVRCTGCTFAYYCGPECQKRHWPSHKDECKLVAKWVGESGPALNSAGFAMLDGFVGSPTATALREQVVELYAGARRHDAVGPTVCAEGKVAGCQDRAGSVYTDPVRGDHIVNVDSHDPRLPALRPLVERLDAFVQVLAVSGAVPELRRVAKRSKPMIAVYPGQATRYRQHIDNPDGNGRLLTALWYLNPNWTVADGGPLRLHPVAQAASATPVQVAASPVQMVPPSSDGTHTDISPIFDRLVCFWSDERTPYEVLPSYATRFAVSVWFHVTEGDQAVS